MKLGLALPHYDFSFPDGSGADAARVIDYAVRAEDLGFDSVWISDHLFLDLARYGGPADRYGTPEAMTLLAGIGARTRRVRVGSLVLCIPSRNDVVLAAEARTIHELTGGRLELGIGAGWYEPEFDEAGIPFGTVGERMRRLEAAAEVLATSPGVPPLWIGGKGGPRIMRLVARHAAGWNVVWRMTPDDYRARREVLHDACAEAGRNPSTVRRSVGLYCLVGEDREDLERRYAALQAWTPGGALDGTSLEGFAEGALVGTPDECAARVKEFAALGVEEIICSFASLPFSVFDDDQPALAARALLPLIR